MGGNQSKGNDLQNSSQDNAEADLDAIYGTAGDGNIASTQTGYRAGGNASGSGGANATGLTHNYPIPPELMVAEITGEIDDHDYFARSMKILESLNHLDSLESYAPEDALDLEDIYLLAEPGYLTLENGYVRKTDGSLYIALFIDLGYELNGDMFGWWFCNVDNDEKFKWWHPLNHISGTWDPSYYSMMNFERLPGHYIDHIHIINQQFTFDDFHTYYPSSSSSSSGGTNNGENTFKPNNTTNSTYTGSRILHPSHTDHNTTTNSTNNSSYNSGGNNSKDFYQIQIEYIRPSKFFDITKFEEYNITACIIGRINVKDTSFFHTYIHFGYVFYIIREINGRSELRIRYLLGDFHYSLENNENYYYSQLLTNLTNNYFFRYWKLPLSLSKKIYKHTLEEMLCLKEFLPFFYKKSLQEQREFQLNYSFAN